MKYIDVEKLKAKLDEHYRKYQSKYMETRTPYTQGLIDALDLAEQVIDSIQQEQPEVDLGKIIEQTYHDGSVADTDDMDHVTYENIARYFFELGQKDAANKYDEIEYNRQKAEEEILDKSLEEAAIECATDTIPLTDEVYIDARIKASFIAGAEWMAGQGVTLKVTDDTTWGEVNDFIHRNCDGAKEIQIRKKED